MNNCHYISRTIPGSRSKAAKEEFNARHAHSRSLDACMRMDFSANHPFPSSSFFSSSFSFKGSVVHASILFLNTRILRVEACGAIFAPWVGNRIIARLNLFIEINYYSNNYLNNSVIERWINKLIFIWYLLDIDHLILFTKKENIEIIKIFMVILNENCISFFLSSIIIWDN